MHTKHDPCPILTNSVQWQLLGWFESSKHVFIVEIAERQVLTTNHDGVQGVHGLGLLACS